MTQRHRTGGRPVTSLPVPLVITDRTQAELEAQRLYAQGECPHDRARMDQQAEWDRADRLEDMGSTNGWSRG